MTKSIDSLSRAAYDAFNYERHDSTHTVKKGGFILSFSSRSGQARRDQICAANAGAVEELLATRCTPGKLLTRSGTDSLCSTELDTEPDEQASCTTVDTSTDMGCTNTDMSTDFEGDSSDEIASVDRKEEERKQGVEIRFLTAQLVDARKQAKMWRAQQEQCSTCAATERLGRQEAEERIAQLAPQCQSLERDNFKLKCEKAQLTKENVGLRQKLQQQAKSTPQKGANRPWRLDKLRLNGDQKKGDQLVQQMADQECGPLKQCSAQEKAALKKKLLLKWHPDRQPSANHSAFATRVMQEMQNRTEWSS